MTIAGTERDRAVYEYTQRVLALIAKAEITPDDASWITRETVDSFRDHINPGFLEYRKATDAREAGAVVEWSDAGPNSYRDVSGRKYLDCLGGFGIFNVGHRHPKVVKAVSDQLRRQPLHSQDLLDPLRAMLAKTLAMLAPAGLDHSFFCNSGTEAVEGALKLARAFNPAKQTIVAATKGFHGKSYGALSASAKAEFRRPFGPMLPNIEHVPFNDLLALRDMMTSCRAVGEDVGAVLLEPIQGEGGVNIPTTTTCRACARSATSSARSSFSTKCRPAWDGPARCFAASITASRPISCAWPKPSAVASCPRARSSGGGRFFRVFSITRFFTRRPSVETP